ncbi:MAG: hypothetical protein ACI4ED_04445 [Suilimivivens sp.]
MNKKILSLFIICSFSFLAAACGPSDEKVLEAQEKYVQLVEIHNQVVEARKDIEDDSLDKSLTQSREQISGLEEYNLAEMKDEEIDELIQNMDALIASYEGALETISDIKEEEEAAMLVTVPVSVENSTSFSFTTLKLYEKGDLGNHANVLEGMDCLAAGQAVAGLLVQKDVDNTPWVLTLSDTEGNEYEFEISVSEYGEDGVALKLVYDSAEGALNLE